MNDSNQDGFSLVEVLLASTLSILLLGSLLWLMHDVLSMSTLLQQQRLLQQHARILDHTLRDILAQSGDSAIYPATSSDWQALTQQAALRLYQVGTDPLPSVLTAHWGHKLLVASTVVDSQSIGTTSVAHKVSLYQVTLHAPIQAKSHSPWLLVAPNAWQLVSLQHLHHQGMDSSLTFEQAIHPALQSPYLVGRYQHHLWFVALNRQTDSTQPPQYGLYEWDLTNGSNPQEIVSGVTQWRGQLVASQMPTTPLTPIARVFHWQITLQAGSLTRQQHYYYLNQHLF